MGRRLTPSILKLFPAFPFWMLISCVLLDARDETFAPAPPDELTVSLEVRVGSDFPDQSLQGRRDSVASRTLKLHRYTIRSEAYRLRFWAEGELREIESPPPVRTYRGHTEEDPNEQICAVLFPDGRMLACGTTGLRWVWYTPSPVAVGDQIPEIVGTDDGRSRWTGHTIQRDPEGCPLETFPPVRPVLRAQLGADIMNRCIKNRTTGDVESAVAWTEWETSIMDQNYTRDLAISFEITEAILRIDPFYPSEQVGEALRPLTEHWKTERSGENWDFVNGFAGPAGGVSGYKNPFSVGPVMHELGHSISMHHPIYGVSMQNPVNHAIALTFLKSEGKLKDFDIAPPTEAPDPVAPAANPDVYVTSPNTPVRMPVLTNDWNSGASAIRIGYYSEATNRGGEVRKITHRESDGTEFDALGYIPPKDFVGKDVAIYQVINEAGLHQTEVVHIHVIDTNAPEAGRWSFEMERDGLSPDAAPPRRHASLPTSSEIIPDGAVGNAVRLTGEEAIRLGDAALLPERPSHFKRGQSQNWGWYPLEDEVGNDFDPLNLDYTFSFWFRISGPDTLNQEKETNRYPQRVGVLVDKADTAHEFAVGYRIGVDEDGLFLYVHEFTGANVRHTIHHEDSVAYNEWHHVTVTFDRSADEASLHLNGKSADEQIRLGKGTYLFAGRSDLTLEGFLNQTTDFDEVMVSYRVLSPGEIRSLWEAGGGR